MSDNGRPCTLDRSARLTYWVHTLDGKWVLSCKYVFTDGGINSTQDRLIARFESKLDACLFNEAMANGALVKVST